MILPLVLALAMQVADSGAVQRVDGRVVRGTRQGPVPIANQWVIVHRVGRDASGPLDSTRTNADGRFSLRYRVTGDTAAMYSATTSHGGIVYPTSPFRRPVVSGDDATIMVFDTTSRPVKIVIGGRHLIIGSPNANGRRPIGEVYDIQNDSTVTLIARDSVTPVWTARIPEAAVDFQLNRSGEPAAGGIMRKGSVVQAFLPISPGIRQVAFTYELPASAFPLSIPAGEPIGVFELLVQEPTARVQGAAFRETEPVSTEGRVFRRFLAQDLGPSTVVRIDLPQAIGALRQQVYKIVAVVVLVAMIGAGAFAFRRGRPRIAAPVAPPVIRRSRELVRAIATLDDDFNRLSPVDEQARAGYEARRAQLKRELADALAAEQRTS